jgi:L-lactate permease
LSISTIQGWDARTQLILRTMPIWLTVFILLLTRIEPVGLRSRLVDPEPNFDLHFGYFLKFELSASLVVRVSEFFNFDDSSSDHKGLSWTYELLYIPFLFPFVVASLVTLLVFKRSLPEGMTLLDPFKASFRRCAASLPLHPAQWNVHVHYTTACLRATDVCCNASVAVCCM